jgi:hypothetical protein
MNGSHLVIGFAIILSSLAMIIWPRQIWLFTHGWRLANPEEARVSNAHMTWTRLSGAVGVVIGLVLIIYAFR